MILVERYLRTLQLFLPKTQRDDIIRELSEEIETDIAELEREIGRSLNTDEEAALIAKYGHPLLAAARYRRQQYLIGPLVFPYYWLLLRVVLILMLAGHVMGGAILLANGAGWSQVGHLTERLVETSLIVIGWLTLLAAVGELWITKSHVLEKWNPRTLVFHPKGMGVSAPATTVSTVPSVSRFIVQAVLGAWWLLALKFPILLFAGGADIVAWAPAMNRIYPLLAFSVVAGLSQQFAQLRGFGHSLFSQIAGVVIGLNSVAFLVLMVTSDHRWVVWNDAATPDARVVNLVNYAFSIAFTAAAVFGTAQVLRGLVRWFSTRARLAVVSVCFGVIVPVLDAHAQEIQPPPLPDDTAIRQILAERVDVKRQSVGIVIGIVTPRERRVIAYGRLSQDNPRAVDGDTIFEIGSVTKVFTALLLAESARRGEISIDDAVTDHLPSNVRMVTSDNKPMTLADLATHTSGLPFWPSNIPANAEGVRLMSGYTVDQLYQFVSTFGVPADVGSRWAYSNMDAGLLGLVLAHRTNTSYERLLEHRVTTPLGMNSTGIAVLPTMQARLAIGHDKTLAAAPRWNVPALLGAGSLHSTVNDLLTFLSATMGHVESPLAPAFRSMLATQRKGPAFQQALGWWIFTNGETQVITHVGGTLGFASQIAYDPKRKIGVVVLANSVNPISDITTQLLSTTSTASSQGR